MHTGSSQLPKVCQIQLNPLSDNYFRSIPLFYKWFQIIVAEVASPAQVEIVFEAGCILVWSVEGIDTATHLPDTCQAPEEEVLDIPADRAEVAADILAGIALVVDLPEVLP